VDQAGAGDVDRQVVNVVIGNVTAPVVVDALRDLHRHAGLAEAVEQPRDLAAAPPQRGYPRMERDVRPESAALELSEEGLEVVDEPTVHLLGRLGNGNESLGIVAVDADGEVGELAEVEQALH